MIPLDLSFYVNPKGVQIRYYFLFLQSCQPYGFKEIVLFTNQYRAGEYINLRYKTLIQGP